MREHGTWESMALRKGWEVIWVNKGERGDVAVN